MVRRWSGVRDGFVDYDPAGPESEPPFDDFAGGGGCAGGANATAAMLRQGLNRRAERAHDECDEYDGRDENWRTMDTKGCGARSKMMTGRPPFGHVDVAHSAAEPLLHHPYHHPRFLVTLVVDALRRLAEVLRLGGVNVGEGLRVAVGEWEPGTLHLHHDLVPGPEGVAGVRQREPHRRRLAGAER